MKPSIELVVIAALLLAAFKATASPSAATAAKKFYPAAEWQQKSVLEGDFSCRGKKETAILGTSKTQIVVAIFLRGFSNKPELLRYSAKVRNPESAILTTEDMYFSVEHFEREIGSLPPGLRPSKTCLGLNMSDLMIDSAHIYWNRKARRFEDWVRQEECGLTHNREGRAQQQRALLVVSIRHLNPG